MKNYHYLLFDLDGTLIDSFEGITRSVAYALSFFDIHIEDTNILKPFIGPPLTHSFKEFYHFNDEEIKKAVFKYRERYNTTGVYENTLYTGIRELLEEASSKGYQVMLATSKPVVFAERILQYFNLDGYFSFIGGSLMDGSRDAKEEVIRHVLTENDIRDNSRVLMIGDRKYDIIGAKSNGIDSLGVLYGYGQYEELHDAGAGFIVKDVPELASLLRLGCTTGPLSIKES